MTSGAVSFTQMTVAHSRRDIFLPVVWKDTRRLRWPKQNRKRKQKPAPLPRAPERVFCRCRRWRDIYRWFRNICQWSADWNTGICFLRCNIEISGNFPYYPLLSMQYLLWSVVKRNHIYRRNSNNQSYHSSRSQPDSLWFQGSDQWTGLRCGGLRRRDPYQLY